MIAAMRFPRFMRRVNRVFTNPLIGTFAGLVPPLAVVHHVGRRSGHSYRTPVVAFRSTGGFVIPLTDGRDVDWARNVLRARGCTIERMRQRFRLHNPRVVNFNTAEPHLPAAVRPVLQAANFPGYVLLDLDAERSRRTGKQPSRSRSRRRR